MPADGGKRDQRVGEHFWDDGGDGHLFPDGMKNPTADRVPREDRTWTDTNLCADYDADKPDQPFGRLACRACGGTLFEVLRTGDYETSARCPCGYYYIVHTG